MYVHNLTIVIIIVVELLDTNGSRVASNWRTDSHHLICICTYAYAAYDTSSWAAPSC